MPVHGGIISDYIFIALEFDLNSVSSQCARGNRLLRENRKSIQNVFNGKKLFKRCNPPDFKFYLDKLNNKKIPTWCNVKFVSVFTALTNTKKAKKI